MRTTLALVLVAAALAGCKSEAPATSTQTTAGLTTGTVSPDGVRRVAIEANQNGYVPARIEAKPGEKLVLVFTRTIDGECLEKVKVAGGEAVELPKGTPVEVAVTAPASGEIKFACGMDMFTGVIVANTKS
jgi:plastocyanin domain-containing protein